MKYPVLIMVMAITASCNQPKRPNGTTASVDASLLISIELLNLDGSPVNQKELEGKAVFLNFWATWCGPCVKEMPYIEEAARQLKDENMVFLLATEESAEKINAFQQKYGYNLDLIRQKTTLASLGITAIPTTYVFNAKGKQVFAETSARKWDTPENIAFLRQLINQP